MPALVQVPAGASTQRFFVTYSGVGLPLRLVTEIAPAQIANRNTFIRAWYDAADRMTGLEKIVYGEVELAHRYRYDASGQLDRVEIRRAGEPLSILLFEDDALIEDIHAAASEDE